MTLPPITESGMAFGPYPDGCCFPIENCQTLQAFGGEKVKIAELLLFWPCDKQGAPVLIVEAKSSSPRPCTQPDFDDFIGDITEKFTNTLMLTVAMLLGRHGAGVNDIPDSFKSLDLGSAKFRFVLVINGHKDEWLPPLKDELNTRLKSLIKIMSLPPTSIAVFNDILARDIGLIA